jgi:hypothetical protein
VATSFWKAVDYLEGAGGRPVGFECRWAAERWRVPAAFSTAYPESELNLVTRANYLEFLTDG